MRRRHLLALPARARPRPPVPRRSLWLASQSPAIPNQAGANSASPARSIANVSITSSSSMSVTCAACCRHASSITTEAARDAGEHDEAARKPDWLSSHPEFGPHGRGQMWRSVESRGLFCRLSGRTAMAVESGVPEKLRIRVLSGSVEFRGGPFLAVL